MEKYGFVYIWRDRKHNRYYIGSHWGTEDDGYVCSSHWMKKAWLIRPQDFKRKILAKVYTNRKDLYEKETYFLSMINEDEIKTRYYNLNIKGTGHWTAYPDKVKSIREKISIKTKEAMQRPEVIAKYKEGMKTRDTKSSDMEVRNKRSASTKQTLAKLTDKQRMNKTMAAHKANTGTKFLWKDGKFKKAIPDSPKWHTLITEGYTNENI